MAAVAAAAVISSLLQGMEFSLALLYGGAAMVAGTVYSARRLKRATDNGLDAAAVFAGAAGKIALLAGLLAAGMWLLHLQLLGLVLGLVLAQAGFLFARGYAPRRRG